MNLSLNKILLTALCETNLDGSINSTTHMYGLAVYVKEGFHFARDLFLENSADSYLCFQLALLQ